MGKKEIVNMISEETGLKKTTVEMVVDCLTFHIVEQVADGNKVGFSGFGTFRSKEVAARLGRNPHTGEAVEIPKRVLPDFRPAKLFKERVGKW